jgi:hypothetical protein
MALNSTEATERGAPLSVFSALSGISGSFIHTLACPEAGVLIMKEEASDGQRINRWAGEDLYPLICFLSVDAKAAPLRALRLAFSAYEQSIDYQVSDKAG